MKIYLVDNVNCKCLLCGFHCKNRNGLSQHLSSIHNISSTEYSIKYLLENKIPVCKCGCGNEIKIDGYKYNEYLNHHNPDNYWQFKYDKNSSEYKEITNKISKSTINYQKEHPQVASEQKRKKCSDNLKKAMSDPIQKKQRIDKMRETKRRQSKEGILQERHWSKVKSQEEVEEIGRRIGYKSSITKRTKFKDGLIETWNKGLTKEDDERIAQSSYENHYRYTLNRILKYPKKFHDKEYRKFLLERQNGVCLIKKTNNKLCLHHVDCDKNNCRPENLIYIERSTHMKIHNSNGYRRHFNELVEEFLKSLDKSKMI